MFRLVPILLLSASVATAADPTGNDFFEAKVRPLLIAKCQTCHGDKKQKCGLRLDTKAGWQQGGEHGPALVPGKPDESLMLKAVRYQDKNLQMPPEGKLTAAEIGVLEQWVRIGAPDPRTGAKPHVAVGVGWWSLRPLRRTGGNSIDEFILAKLREKGLSPAPNADRWTLIRRLTVDLHGLLPTPEEVAAFVADTSPDAYEKLVDRLLASPRYGERWARHWLDAIHFAETHGAEHDLIRPTAWKYRDYVIDSFNRDTPYSRFVKEQLAPDVFYSDDPKLTVALGFLAAGPFDQSTASTAPETFLYLDRDDMVMQTLSTFASATVHCARCHDHKFDPISQADYYALQAVFAGIGRGEVPYDPDPTVGRERAKWQKLTKAAESRDRTVLLGEEARQLTASWEKSRGANVTWAPLQAETFVAANGSKLLHKEGVLHAAGSRPDIEVYTVTGKTSLHEVTAIRLDVLDDDALPKRGPGRQDNGNFHLSEFEMLAFEPGAERGKPVKIARAVADFDQTDWMIAHTLDGNLKSAWGIHPHVGQPHAAVFQLAEPLKLPSAAKLVIVLKQLHGAGHVIGKFRLSLSGDAIAGSSLVPLSVAEILRIAPEKRTPEQQLSLAEVAVKQKADEALAKLPPQQFVYAGAPNFIPDGQPAAVTKPRPVHVLTRGDLNKKAELAKPGALAALKLRFEVANPDDEASRRVALAEWLVDRDNPLTWRSIVNRVWHHHFGRGLVDTPNDFGRMGSLPSHPELLDWLAVEFRDNGQSLKKLHRLIVTSAAYKQASRTDVNAATIDADNRLLWRMSRRRLDAETYRDAVLQVSGKLDLTMGGPSVQQFTLSKGPQSTPNVHYDKFDWNAPAAGRRSIYRLVYRTIPDPFLDALDFPDAALLAPTRGFSASSLQALALLNNTFVLKQSEFTAARLAKVGDVRAQAREAFRLMFQRSPNEAELRGFVAYAEKHGVANLCRVLFNSNEFLFVE